MAFVTNASPQVVLLGTDDKSIKAITPKPISVPSALAQFFDVFQKGPTEKMLVDGGKALKLYGEESFNIGSKYYNYHKKFITDIIGAGSSVMLKRVIPDDVDNKANVAIYLDILTADLPVYKRNVDGSIAHDEDGNPIQDTDSDGNPKTTQGYKIKIISEVNNIGTDGSSVGTLTIKPGTMSDDDDNKSTMYPIVEFSAKYLGEYYNNIGFGIELLKNDKIPEGFIEEAKFIPYTITMYEKDENGTPVVIKDLWGAVAEKFGWSTNAKDPSTNLSLTLIDTLANWYNVTDINLPLEYPKVEDPYIYQSNLETVLGLLVAAENEYINADITTVDGIVVNTSEWFDFIDTDDLTKQRYLLNAFNAYSTKRVPYYGCVISDDAADLAANQKEVIFTKNTPFFMGGGKDGNIDWSNVETLVSRELKKYLDENSEYMDMATNVETIMYDVGYSLDIKKKLINFITVRKDTFVVLSTREYNDINPKSLVDARATAINLKAALQLAPESTYFGTPVARGMIVVGDGRLSNWVDRSYWPLTYDIAIKTTKMMGAGDGKWKAEYLFDQGNRNIIETMYDIQPAFIPQGVKPALWNLGLVWPQPFDLRRYHYPALQTAYDNDTSVLNNYFNAMALTVIEKVAAETWRNFTGNTNMTPAEFTEAVEQFAISRLKDRFAGIVRVIPEAMITDFDAQRGYSWTMKFKMYGNVMKTVMFAYIVALREE